MPNLSSFDPNSVGNPNNTIFGLPFSEQDAQLVILPVPWEVTVSYNAGTATAPEKIFNASLQVDLYDSDCIDGWRKGIFMKEINKEVFLQSNDLRKKAERYIHHIAQGNEITYDIRHSLIEINKGCTNLHQWVFEQTSTLLNQKKLIGLLGGDHSIPLGFIKALANTHPEFGILQIDAHCDLRKAYEDFIFSHASIMYNVIEEIPAVKKLVQVGVRDYCDEELHYIQQHKHRITTYFDRDIKTKLYEGTTWKAIAENIVAQLPQKVYISFDIDGLDPKLCPSTGTPVPGGFETEQIFYIIRCISNSGRTIIGFDLNEVGTTVDWDANVGARVLYKLCNFILSSNK